MGKAGRLTSLVGALQRVKEARLCASETRDTAASMEWQAAPVSAAPAAPSTETTPNAAASVPPAGDEAPPAAPTAEAPPVNTRLSPTDEDPTAGATAPPDPQPPTGQVFFILSGFSEIFNLSFVGSVLCFY